MGVDYYAAAPPDDKERRKWEKKMRLSLTRLFTEQKKRVMKAVRRGE